jgi:hypothetical protein
MLPTLYSWFDRQDLGRPHHHPAPSRRLSNRALPYVREKGMKAPQPVAHEPEPGRSVLSPRPRLEMRRVLDGTVRGANLRRARPRVLSPDCRFPGSTHVLLLTVFRGMWGRLIRNRWHSACRLNPRPSRQLPRPSRILRHWRRGSRTRYGFSVLS